jgi:hypothetical protein
MNQEYKLLLQMLGTLILVGCGSGTQTPPGNENLLNESSVVLVATSDESGETITFVGDESSGANARRAIAAVYNSPAGDKFTLFIDGDGRPTEAVANGIVMRFSNWSLAEVDVTIFGTNGASDSVTLALPVQAAPSIATTHSLRQGKSIPDYIRDLADGISLVGCLASSVEGLTLCTTLVGCTAGVAVIALGCDSLLAPVLGLDLPEGWEETSCVANATVGNPSACLSLGLNAVADYLEARNLVPDVPLPGSGNPPNDMDSDGDGTLDSADACPSDPNKTTTGECGCGNQDTPGCGNNPPPVDSDGDGVADGTDNCPSDPNKTSPGNCGCGSLELLNCNDPPLEVTDRIRAACSRYSDAELTEKLLFYQSEASTGLSLTGALGLSETECYNYSFSGVRCGGLDSIDCQDMCQTCEATVIDLYYNPTASVYGQITTGVRSACAAYSDPELARKLLFYESEKTTGRSLTGALGLSETECYNYSFSGVRCGDLDSIDCQDMCQTCEATVIDLLYNPSASVYGQITTGVRSACAAYSDPELARKLLFYESQKTTGRSLSGALNLSETECYNYSFSGVRCGGLDSIDCQDMCQTCEATVIDLLYNPSASVYGQITTGVRSACAAYSDPELGRKLLIYQSEKSTGRSRSGALSLSETECYNYSFSGVRCGDLDSIDCQDMCQTCEATIIGMLYDN